MTQDLMKYDILYHIDPTKNMARYYAICCTKDLFDNWILEKNWGRIGTQGQKQIFSFASLQDAENAYDKICNVKIRKGYYNDSLISHLNRHYDRS